MSGAKSKPHTIVDEVETANHYLLTSESTFSTS